MSKTTDKVIQLAEEELATKVNQQKSQFPTLKAIASVQQECAVIHKGTQGYGYSYADLASIYKELLPLMKKHNLGFMQPIVGTNIKTVIFHTKDANALPVEEIAQIPQGVELRGMNAFQVYGSAITYFRRYCLSSLLGLITDKDIDAAGTPTKKAIKRLKLHTSKMGDVIKKLQSGEVTMEVVEKHYDLTEAQKNTLKLC